MRTSAWCSVAYGFLVLSLAFASSAKAADPELPKAGFQIKAEASDPERPTRKFREAYQGEIIDGLAHLQPPQIGKKIKNIEDPVKLMKNAGIKIGVLMPTPNEGLDISNEDPTRQKMGLAHKSGGRILAFCGGDYLSDWMGRLADKGVNPDDLKRHLDRITAELANADCTGLGELGFMHFDKKTYQNVIHTHGEFGPMLQLIDVVAASGKWLQLHAEPVEPNGTRHDAESFRALALWYRLHPDLKIIMSHTAMTNVFNARHLLTLYPNLIMSIKLRPKSESWEHLEPVVNRKGQLYGDWAKLMEEFPTRFIVGSDVKFDTEEHHSGDKYEDMVNKFRDILGSLDPAAAEAIAHGNIERMYGIHAS